ncbi:response regulator [Gemmatimonadota bacterium]
MVDDDDGFRNTLVDTLQKEVGFNIKVASDEYEIGRMVAGFDPNVLIFNLMMFGINGFKVSCPQ